MVRAVKYFSTSEGVRRGPRRATKGEKDAAAVCDGVNSLDRVFRGADGCDLPLRSRLGNGRFVAVW